MHICPGVRYLHQAEKDTHPTCIQKDKLTLFFKHTLHKFVLDKTGR
jgi:hypothetical protein